MLQPADFYSSFLDYFIIFVARVFNFFYSTLYWAQQRICDYALYKFTIEIDFYTDIVLKENLFGTIGVDILEVIFTDRMASVLVSRYSVKALKRIQHTEPNPLATGLILS